MNAASSIIVSRYGNHVVEWDSPAFNEVMATLRHEREGYQHDIGIETDISEAEHSALLARAEGIKLAASNHISDNAESGA